MRNRQILTVCLRELVRVMTKVTNDRVDPGQKSTMWETGKNRNTFESVEQENDDAHHRLDWGQQEIPRVT